MSGGLRAVRGAERVHDEHVAQRGVLLRQRLVVGLLTDVHAAVLQQHQLAGLHVDAVDPVLDQRHFDAEQLGQTPGDRRQRIDLAPHAFLRPAQVRHHHHRRAFFQRKFQCRQRGGDALLGGNAAGIVAILVFNGHVQVFADQHALTGKDEIGHADDGHGGLLSKLRRGAPSHVLSRPAREMKTVTNELAGPRSTRQASGWHAWVSTALRNLASRSATCDFNPLVTITTVPARPDKGRHGPTFVRGLLRRAYFAATTLTISRHLFE